MYASIVSMVRNQIGNQNEIYVPLMYVIFNFVLFNNLIGLVPYSFTPTSYLIITIALSTTIVLAVTLIGLLRHGLVFFSYFVPAGTPLALVPLLVVIEIISYIARSLSLGLRLGANIIAGHSLLKIFSGFTSSAITIGPIIMICSILPLLVLTILYSLELAIAFLQAYVFTILTSSYLKDALDLH
jgi:F-type H+-transporting ATPase subunit a